MEETHANVIAGALSGLQQAALGAGAEVIALLQPAESSVEVIWFWDRSGNRALDCATLPWKGFVPDTGVAAAGSGLAATLRNALSTRSQSFLLFPSQGGRRTGTAVIGFTEPNTPASAVSEAILEKLSLVEWASWSVAEIARLRGELKTLNERLAGRKLVERAKNVLQTERNISEEQAYAYLRGLSRRRRITLAALASEIMTKRPAA